MLQVQNIFGKTGQNLQINYRQDFIDQKAAEYFKQYQAIDNGHASRSAEFAIPPTTKQIRFLQKCLALKPNSHKYHREYAYLLAESGATDDALFHLLRARNLKKAHDKCHELGIGHHSIYRLFLEQYYTGMYHNFNRGYQEAEKLLARDYDNIASQIRNSSEHTTNSRKLINRYTGKPSNNARSTQSGNPTILQKNIMRRFKKAYAGIIVLFFSLNMLVSEARAAGNDKTNVCWDVRYLEDGYTQSETRREERSVAAISSKLPVQELETDHFALAFAKAPASKDARDDVSAIEVYNKSFSIKNSQKNYKNQSAYNEPLIYKALTFNALHFVCTHLDKNQTTTFGHDRTSFRDAALRGAQRRSYLLNEPVKTIGDIITSTAATKRSNYVLQPNRSVPSPRGEGQDEGVRMAGQPWSLSAAETWSLSAVETWRSLANNLYRKLETDHFALAFAKAPASKDARDDTSTGSAHRTSPNAAFRDVSETASIQGSVTLSNGVPVPNALVQFQSLVDDQYSFTLVTDSNGQFDTANIPIAIDPVNTSSLPAFYTWPQGGSSHHVVFRLHANEHFADADIIIYNMQGIAVTQLNAQIYNGAAHAYWNGTGQPAGMYVARRLGTSGKIFHNPNGANTDSRMPANGIEAKGNTQKSLTGNYTVSISPTEASNMQFDDVVESANIQDGLNVLDYFISPTAFEYVFTIGSSNGSNASVSISQDGNQIVNGVLDETGSLVTDRQFLEDSVSTFTFYAQKDGYTDFDSTFTGKWNGHDFNFSMDEIIPVDSVEYTVYGETGTDGVSYQLSRHGNVFVTASASQQAGNDHENVITRHPDELLDSLEILVEKEGMHPWDTVIGLQAGLNEIDFPSLQIIPDYVLNDYIWGDIIRKKTNNMYNGIGNAFIKLEGLNTNYSDSITMNNDNIYEFTNLHLAVDGAGNALPTQYKRTILPTDTTSTQMFKEYVDTVTITQADTDLGTVVVQQLDQNVTLRGIARAYDRDTLSGNKIIEHRSLEAMNTIPGVTVKFVTPEQTYETVTNANGEYVIPNVPCGTLGTWEVGYTDTLSNPFFSNVGHTHQVKDEVIHPDLDSVKRINWVMIYRDMSIPATENDPNYGNTQSATPAEISEMIRGPPSATGYGTIIEEALGHRMKINLGNLTTQQQEEMKERIKDRDSLFYGIKKTVDINNVQRPFEIVYSHIPVEEVADYHPFTNPQTDSLGWNVYKGINETQIRGPPVENYKQYEERSITGGEITVSLNSDEGTLKEIEMRANYFNNVGSRPSVGNINPTYPNLKDRAIMSEIKDNNMTRWNTDSTGTWYSEYPIDKLEYTISSKK